MALYSSRVLLLLACYSKACELDKPNLAATALDCQTFCRKPNHEKRRDLISYLIAVWCSSHMRLCQLLLKAGPNPRDAFGDGAKRIPRTAHRAAAEHTNSSCRVFSFVWFGPVCDIRPASLDMMRGSTSAPRRCETLGRLRLQSRCQRFNFPVAPGSEV